VHRGEALVADRRHLLAHEEVAREVEAGLGRNPGQGDEEKQCSQHEPKRVAARVAGEVGAAATSGAHRQPECESDAEGRQHIDPARIEVALVDDARNRGQQAEPDRQPDEQPRPTRERGQRDRRERERIVEEDERAAEAGGEVARLIDVVQRLGREARVGDECRGRLEPEQRPGDERLA
jgi:hypothetical protein